MPQTDPGAFGREASDWQGQAENFSAALARAIDGTLDAIDATDAEVALGVLALHGQGREPGTGMNLALGSGLSCRITNGRAWILGRPVVIDDPAEYLVVALPANATTWVYLDDDAAPHLSAALIPSEEKEPDWICLGWARTTAAECVETNMDDAEIIGSIAELDSEIAALTLLIQIIQAAIGEEYFTGTPPSRSLHRRVTDLEDLGGGGGGGIVYASLLEWSSTDPRLLAAVIQDMIDDSFADHVALYHGSSGGSGGSATPTSSYFDWAIIDQHRGGIRITEYGSDPDFPDSQAAAIYIVWGCYGHGENGTPDYVHPSSTWLPA